MLKIFTFILLSVFVLNADTSCFENYEAYVKCKRVKKVIKKNIGNIPDYVLKDAVDGYLERPLGYSIEDEWTYIHSKKIKEKHHDKR